MRDCLTAREHEILVLIAQGKSGKEIATELNCSPKTVAAHRYKLMGKLSARNSVDLLWYAIRHGLVETKALPVPKSLVRRMKTNTQAQ